MPVSTPYVEMVSTMSSAGTELATAEIGTTDRSVRERWIELGLVLFVGLAQPLFRSLYYVLFGVPQAKGTDNVGYLYLSIQEAGAILVLWYVLRRSNRTFSTIGFRPNIRGALWGVALAVVGLLAYGYSYDFLQLVHKQIWGSWATPHDLAGMFPKASWTVLIPDLLLTCFFEETIVRGYLMTEISELTGSINFAIVASVLVQTSYHTYQGWLMATSAAAGFTLFSLYYALTGKLFPVYIAHVAIDCLWIAQLTK